MQDIFNRGFCKPRRGTVCSESHRGMPIFDCAKLLQAINTAFEANNLILSGPIHYNNRSVLRNRYNPDDQQYQINIDYLEAIDLKSLYRSSFENTL